MRPVRYRATVDDLAVGRLLRAVRIRRGWRQADVAERAGVSQSQVSRVECGRLDALRLREIRSIGAALEVRVRIEGSWRGGDGARIVNEGHVHLQGAVAAAISRVPGWQCTAEVAFAWAGERGTIDLLAWHAGRRAMLIVEVKTELVDPAAVIAQTDRYRRAATAVARERGWDPLLLGLWVVIGDGTMNRRRAALAGALLGVAFPSSGPAIRAWLRGPDGPIRALSFARSMPPGNGARRTVAVRRVSAARGRGNGTRDAGRE